MVNILQGVKVEIRKQYPTTNLKVNSRKPCYYDDDDDDDDYYYLTAY